MRKVSLFAAIMLVLGIVFTGTAAASTTTQSSAYGVRVISHVVGQPLVTLDPTPAAAYPPGQEKTIVGPLSFSTLVDDVSILHAGAEPGHAEAHVAHVSLLNGQIEARVVHAAVHERCGDEPSFKGSILVGLTVGGIAYENNPTPNTTIALPGGITVVLNEQSQTANSGSVTMIHVIDSTLGVVDADIKVAHAEASANCTPAPTTTPKPLPTPTDPSITPVPLPETGAPVLPIALTGFGILGLGVLFVRRATKI